MSQTIAVTNPFTYGGPIRQERDFFGRKQELLGVLEQVAKGGSVNLVGERRVGKTSLLFHMMRPDVRAQYLPPTDQCIFCYIDTQVCAMSPEGFFKEVFIAAKLAVPELDIAPQEVELNEARVRAYLRAIQPYRLVLLVDEFECITQSPEFPPRFFIFLRGLSTSYAVSLVVATCRRLVDTCPIEVVSSPFPNIFGHVQLGGFAPAELDELLAVASANSHVPIASLRDQIVNLAGYFPYLVQMACWHYFRRWQETGSFEPADHQAVARAFAAEATLQFASVWSRYLDDNERGVMSLLAADHGVVEQHLVWQLQEKGYLIDGHIGSHVLRDYVREQTASAVHASAEQPAIPAVGVYVDLESGNAYADGQLIDPPLPEHQFRLLKLLYQDKGKICTFYRIVEAVWSEAYMDQIDDQRIAQLISRLRRRVEPHGKPWKYIQTVRGRGLTLGDG
jgi:serine/threonine-protein kinase